MRPLKPFRLWPRHGQLAARWRRASLWLLGITVALHAQFLSLVPPLGAKTGGLLALYDSGLGAGARGINAQALQYMCAFLLAMALALEFRAARRDSNFPAEFWSEVDEQGELGYGAGLFGLLTASAVTLLAYVFEDSLSASDTLYATIACAPLGCMVLVALTLVLLYTTLCRIGWAVMAVVGGARR